MKKKPVVKIDVPKVSEKFFNKIRIEYKATYKKEVTPERIADYKSQINKFLTIEEKIRFAENELNEYLKNLSPELLDVSAVTILHKAQPKGSILWDRYLELDIENLKKELNNQKNVGNRIALKYKEIALAYIFETYSIGKDIPSSSQGEFSKKEIESIGKNEYTVNGNSFYKAVRKIIADYSPFEESDLYHISPRWYDVVKEITTKRKHWKQVEKYLKEKKYLKE
jgi:hypothetical protein